MLDQLRSRKGGLARLATRLAYSVSQPVLTVAHGVGIRQAEAGQIDHTVGQVNVEASHRRLQVAELVEHHHASLHHRHHGSPRRGRHRRAVSVGGAVDPVFHRILLRQIPQEGQLLQTGDPLWRGGEKFKLGH